MSIVVPTHETSSPTQDEIASGADVLEPMEDLADISGRQVGASPVAQPGRV